MVGVTVPVWASVCVRDVGGEAVEATSDESDSEEVSEALSCAFSADAV